MQRQVKERNVVKAALGYQFEVAGCNAHVVFTLFVRVSAQRSQGVGFIRLHIPWPILSREAELQKIKVAVKKVRATQSLPLPDH